MTPVLPGAGLAVRRVGRSMLLLPASLGTLAVLADLAGPEADDEGAPVGWIGTARALWELGADAEQGIQETAAGCLVLLAAVLLVGLVLLCGALAAGACQHDLAESPRLLAAVRVLSVVMGLVLLLTLPFAAGQLGDDGQLLGGTVVLAALTVVTAAVVAQTERELRSDV